MSSRSNSARRARPYLGTIVEVTAWAADDTPLTHAIDHAFAAIEVVQQRMSLFEASSDVARINTAPAQQPVQVSHDTATVLHFAHALGEASDGTFDIATAGVLASRGFLPPALMQAAEPGVTFRDLEFVADDAVCWRRKGCIDLGGIAKGYAVDRAIVALQTAGITSAVVNAGGDLRCIGVPQTVLVRDPQDPSLLRDLGRVTDAAVATSAGYFSSMGTGHTRVDRLVDPGLGDCTTWNGSVTVVAPDCMTADALTKVVRLAPARAPELLARYRAEAILLDGLGQRRCGEAGLLSAAPL